MALPCLPQDEKPGRQQALGHPEGPGMGEVLVLWGVPSMKEKELGCGERFLRVRVTLAEVEASQSGSGGISARVSQTALF